MSASVVIDIAIRAVMSAFVAIVAIAIRAIVVVLMYYATLCIVDLTIEIITIAIPHCGMRNNVVVFAAKAGEAVRFDFGFI